MSAMPERVPFNAITIVEGKRLVPEKRALDAESRLFAAEARVRELEVLVRNTEVDTNGAPVTELNTLRAERDALVPLARKVIEGIGQYVGLLDDDEEHGDCGLPMERQVELVFGVTVEQAEKARAILAREAGA